MNGAKIYHSKFGNLETIKLRHILFPRSSFEFITKLNSHQIMNLLKKKPGWVQSERMLDAVTTNEPAGHRDRLPSAPGTVVYCLQWFGFRSSLFFQWKVTAYRSHKS